MIPTLISSFFLCTFLCLLIIRYKHVHTHFSSDTLDGPQKFHKNATPRIGGLPIYISICSIWAVQNLINKTDLPYQILVASAPVFMAGFLEDITKKVGVKLRLFSAFMSGILAFFLLYAHINSIDLPFFDQIFSYFFVSLLFTSFAIAGVSNAYNIIDGFNGLASMVSIICLFAISIVSWHVQDFLIIKLCFSMIAPLFGFFIWNYPRGLIFLGDAGAYLIGFWTSVLSILVVSRNHEISPWFALLVNAYPITETLFTIWRRSIHQGKNPGLPDAAHFHSLIYRRVVKWATPNNEKAHIKASKNAATSPYLWILSSLGVVPAIVFWNSTMLLMASSLGYVIFYIWAYRQIVRFKASKFLK
jgi:UDP-GlcNAc:undecaprenyl-phosphate/decaprenyl-phosphate GlcNAc-1-phosphate transferase